MLVTEMDGHGSSGGGFRRKAAPCNRTLDAPMSATAVVTEFGVVSGLPGGVAGQGKCLAGIQFATAGD